MNSNSRDRPSPDEGSVLSEDELDITDHENVEQLDESRFVVSASGRPSVTPMDRPRDVASMSPDASDSPTETPTIDESDVNEWLVDDLDDANAKYGFHITAKFDGDVDQHQILSNDVVTSFETLLIWYANQVGDGTPVEDVLGILLAESNVSVRYPVQTLVGLLDQHDLGHADTIGDLLEAVSEDDGIDLSSR